MTATTKRFAYDFLASTCPIVVHAPFQAVEVEVGIHWVDAAGEANEGEPYSNACSSAPSSSNHWFSSSIVPDWMSAVLHV